MGIYMWRITKLNYATEAILLVFEGPHIALIVNMKHDYKNTSGKILIKKIMNTMTLISKSKDNIIMTN